MPTLSCASTRLSSTIAIDKFWPGLTVETYLMVAAMVAAVVTYRTRSAIREVAKAFSLPVGTKSAREVERDLIQSPDLSEQKRNKILEVVDGILDFPRHLSIHSGGFTLSADDLDTIVPIEPATMEGRSS